MTPKEKAEEICRKMLYQIEWNAQPSTVKGVAKQCALIAVDEMINELEGTNSTKEGGFFWKEVKKEVEKL